MGVSLIGRNFGDEPDEAGANHCAENASSLTGR
jgi:hypothetical protein